MSQPPVMPVDKMNERISRCTFNKWLGLEVVAATSETLEAHATWRDEMVGSPETGMAHGGILAAIIDGIGSYVVMAATGLVGSTLDMRIDYHRGVRPGQITAKGTILKAGRTISSADVHLYDTDGKLVTSGRVVYFLGGKQPTNPA